jgi:DNA-binding Xre family transcriptional regulator
MAIRWRVREIAEPERWNAKKLAEATGLAYGTVYAIWTNQATRVDFKTLEALARVLKVRPGELISANGEEQEIESPALAAA